MVHLASTENFERLTHKTKSDMNNNEKELRTQDNESTATTTDSSIWYS